MIKKLSALVFGLLATIGVMAQSPHLHVQHFTTRDGLASNVVNCGLQDRHGYIWFGTNHGLTRFDGHRFVNFYVEENGEQLIEGITHLAEDTTKNVLLIAGKGYRLLCFDLDRMCFVSADGMKYPKDNDEERDEQTYLARTRTLGIDRGNKTNRRHDLHYARLDDGRELFATIDNGFFLYEPQTKQLFHYRATDEQPVIESDYINGVMKDRYGGVWLLTTFAGVCRIETGNETVGYHSLADNIRSFAQLDSHHIAVADMEGHVYSYDPDTRQSSLIFNRGVRAYAVNTDSKGRIWIGTRGEGVWIIEDMKTEKLEGLPARQIYDIKFSEKGTAWIATLDGGLIEGHEKTDGSFVFFQHLLGEGIHEIDLDATGRLWIATENGVLMKNGEKTDTIFNKGKVVCICHSNNGIIWAGSNGYGLLKIDQGKVSFIQADDGLANNCVESVACDKEGNVIVGTDQGISVVSSDGSIRNFYSQYGLRADTYNENAILYTTTGRVFLGSLTGLAELRTTESQVNHPVIQTPSITCVGVNNVPHYGCQDHVIRLSHKERNLTFSFSSFAYHDLPSVTYSYWLEGVDRDWRPSTKESQATFTNLSPGHYTLHVRSRLPGTPWSEETLCDIYIAQPWYWTWWARAFYILAIALLAGYEWHQYRQRQSLRRQLDQRLSALYAVRGETENSAEKPRCTVEENDETEGNVAKPRCAVEERGEGLEVPQRDKTFLDKLDQLIIENMLQTDLDVHFIAEKMCISYSTLHRRIKSLTGMTANEYVRKHRLAKAMQLLHDGHNATEVSMLCGFSSPSYFTRCFKAEYGLLPSEEVR